MKNSSRRTFLKWAGALIGGAAAGAYLPSCTDYEIEGVKIVRPTDGQLLPTTADYFKTLKTVTSYDDELADLLNEVWTKEMDQTIDHHTGIDFVDAPLGGYQFARYCRTKRFSWTECHNNKTITVKIEKRQDPNGTLETICHELGHQFSNKELIPELTAHRICTTAPIHFPIFGAESNYMTFRMGHSVLYEMLWEFVLGYCSDTKEEHCLSGLAMLLALNQNNGSHAQANTAMNWNDGLYGQVYMAQARQFIDYCRAQPRVQNVKIVSPEDPETENIFSYPGLALTDLWHKVAQQIIEYNVEKNSFDAVTKQNLKSGLKKAARFPTRISLGTVENPPILMPQRTTFYKEGFEVPLAFMVTPVGYDYSIPKGL